MTRIPFPQVLKSASIDLRREYDRLFSMFYDKKVPDHRRESISLRNYFASNFIKLPFRGTCISLDDFDDLYGFLFVRNPSDFDIDYLVSFCEYSYNFAESNISFAFNLSSSEMYQAVQLYVKQVLLVIELIGYMKSEQDKLTIFVPKNQAVISVAEIINPNLSYKVIEYNHHSMKGDIKRKRDIIILLADQLEPQRAKLKQTNSSLETDLFFLLNNINLRHNNIDPNGKNYKAFIAGMKQEELEEWYDETYQMCLLAFLELDHEERKARITQLKQDIQK